MKEERINGKELLERIKNNTIPIHNIIRVSKVNKDNNTDTLICNLKYTDDNILFKLNAFKIKILNDDYIFTIIDKEPLITAMQQIGIDDKYIKQIDDYIDDLVFKL